MTTGHSDATIVMMSVELCGSKNFISVPVSGFFGTEKPLFGSVIFKKEEQCKCMNSFMYVSSIFTK
jgi:hypothetical protein